MASIAGLGKIGLPRLSENMDPEDARALRNYLYQMQEQLQYVLCNLDTENFSEELRGRRAELLDGLAELRRATRAGLLPFPEAALEDFLAG